MQKSRFFNSNNGDRRYKAEDWAEYFASFIGNGVFPVPSTSLQVMADADMNVMVRSGKAWINGYHLHNTADHIFTLANADGTLPRIDRVVARWSLEQRSIQLYVKKGTFTSNPTAPELQRDADVYELGLADIRVNAGAIAVEQADITDLRLNTDLCGIVTGTVKQADTTTIFNQYEDWFRLFTAEEESRFDEWFQTVTDILDENVAGHLLNLIMAGWNRPFIIPQGAWASLSEPWGDYPCYADVALPDVRDGDAVDFYFSDGESGDGSAAAALEAGISRIDCALHDGNVRFYAASIPPQDLTGVFVRTEAEL